MTRLKQTHGGILKGAGKAGAGSYAGSYALRLITAVLLALCLPGCQTPDNSTADKTDAGNGAATGSGNGSNNIAGNNPSQAISTEVKKGSPAPGFSFTAVDGTKASLADYKGKVVLINLWASWCSPCVREMPDIDRLKQDNPELVVLAVNVGESAADAEKFIQNNNYGFTWVIDESGEIGRAYPSDGIPYTIIVDKQGDIQGVFLGSPSDVYNAYSEAVKPLLS